MTTLNNQNETRHTENHVKPVGRRSANVMSYKPLSRHRTNRGEFHGSDELPSSTEVGLEEEFYKRFGRLYRYCAVWGRWLVYTGTRWKHDETLKVLDDVRRLCRAVALEAGSPTLTRKIASQHTVRAVETLARADQRLAVTPETFDQDPFALNTPLGIIDLRTGALHRHEPDRYHMRLTAVGPSQKPKSDGSSCPRWMGFLEDITNGNADLSAYLQRAIGYTLTGDTSAHVMFFAYGTGANGKSVLINTLTDMMGDYATTAPADVFLASKHERHPTELADLQGVRLVAAAELDSGRRWSESRIKQVTGGDKIKARFMRRDFFEYKPQFKIFMAGNHKPAFGNVDEALRRRLQLVPFDVTIPKEKRDHTLPNVLKAEWPGILKWAIDGCITYLQDGLTPPKIVTDATNDYLEEEDTKALWLYECCDVDVSDKTRTQELFNSYAAWCSERNEWVGSEKAFSQALVGKGLLKTRISGRMGFIGVRLKTTGSHTSDSDGSP